MSNNVTKTNPLPITKASHFRQCLSYQGVPYNRRLLRLDVWRHVARFTSENARRDTSLLTGDVMHERQTDWLTDARTRQTDRQRWKLSLETSDLVTLTSNCLSNTVRAIVWNVIFGHEMPRILISRLNFAQTWTLKKSAEFQQLAVFLYYLLSHRWRQRERLNALMLSFCSPVCLSVAKMQKTRFS